MKEFLALCGVTLNFGSIMRDNQVEITFSGTTLLVDKAVVEENAEVFGKLKATQADKEKIESDYKAAIEPVNFLLERYVKIAGLLQEVYIEEKKRLIVDVTGESTTNPLLLTATSSDEKLVTGNDQTQTHEPVDESSDNTQEADTEPVPKPGSRGALRYAIIQAVRLSDDFLTNDEVFDYLIKNFSQYKFVKRNVISGLKDARQAKSVIGVPVEGPRISFLHGLPEFWDDTKNLASMKDVYLNKLVSKIELYGLTIGDLAESEKREVLDLEASEKKLPSVDADGNTESETNGEEPSTDAAEKLNGYPLGQLSFSNSN